MWHLHEVNINNLTEAAEVLRSGFSRSSGTPIMKAQLLLGAALKPIAETNKMWLVLSGSEEEETGLEQRFKKIKERR